MINSLEALPVQTVNTLSIEQLKASWARSEPVKFGDPTLARAELSLQETFYPLGFPVLISTNCGEVLDAAAECWGLSSRLFQTKPILLSIGVTDGDSTLYPAPPLCRMRGHLCSNIADAENFGISDFDQGTSLVWVTRAALEHRSYFCYFFLESAALSQIANRYAWGIHGACVDLDGAGVLLCGDSGAGKSTLAYACARAGWTFVSDDGSYLVDGRDDRMVVGNCRLARFRPESQNIFPELIGRPVIQRADAGKPSIEFTLDNQRQIIAAPTARVRYIVYLNRNASRHELVPFPTEVARLHMLQCASCAPGHRTRQTAIFDRLLEVGTFELRYGDLDWAIQRLEQLVREGY